MMDLSGSNMPEEPAFLSPLTVQKRDRDKVTQSRSLQKRQCTRQELDQKIEQAAKTPPLLTFSKPLSLRAIPPKGPLIRNVQRMTKQTLLKINVENKNKQEGERTVMITSPKYPGGKKMVAQPSAPRPNSSARKPMSFDSDSD
jgi:hypothetical protein